MLPFDEVGDRVFRRRYESLDLNVGVVVGEGELLVVDSRASHREADELLAELAAFGSLRVSHLVNTHWHWDHVWGNARFSGVELWGHARTRSELIERGELERSRVRGLLSEELHPDIDEVELVPPDRTFTALADVMVGGRRVELRHHGRGHTNADIVIHVPDAGVSFLGDLIEEGAPPQFGSSYPLEWPVTLEVIEASLHPVVVPGHGDVVDCGFVTAQRRELERVADLVAEAMAGGPVEELAASMPYPEEFGRVAISRGLAQAGRPID